MADETLQTYPTDHPPPVVQEPEQLPLLASLPVEVQSPTELQPEVPITEAAAVIIQKTVPLEPPLAADLTTVTATVDPVAAAQAEPQLKELIESEIPKPPPKSFPSFKEESNRISDLSHSELHSLQELKNLVANLSEEVSVWGVPLLKDERTDVILLKFLRARDFKIRDSFTMLKNTINWRKDFNVDELVMEDLGVDLDRVVFMHGHDKEGHPVCYNAYGEFQNRELYSNTFADEEKRMRFLRWRIQFLERSIRQNMDFSPSGISSIFQVSDLKNSPGPAKRELRIATKHALLVLQDNYPEFVAKQVFINVPWWYLAFYKMMSPFLTKRTRSKFVFASPTKTTETLFKYISPEQVPTQYGGLSLDICERSPEFTVDDPATEITINPATKQIMEIIVNEKCSIVWELRVVGWDVCYTAEYVPNTEGAYALIIQKTRKMLPQDEPVVSNSFNITELGKILLTIDNPTSKKKKLLYRYKVVPSVNDIDY